ncbi:MAG: hypothetical protein HQK55_16025 [Deltaproteobacteria bacterium]|nr:hypothetical protein [Deltaproteobacteria bacterium]
MSTPLCGVAVKNTGVWILAFAPILGAILQAFLSGLLSAELNRLWWVTIALNVGLSYFDDYNLKSAGHDTRSFGGWAWLVPVYLYKRATALKQSKGYFIVWMCCFLLSFGINEG